MEHLHKDRWFCKTSTGSLKMKRVSKKLEGQFPREYRKIYQAMGVVGLVFFLQKNAGYSLAEARAKIKFMFNT